MAEHDKMGARVSIRRPPWTSNLVLATRTAPELLFKLTKRFALGPDLRQMASAVVTGAVTICALSHEM
jgi:hypothetical protein